MAVERVSGFGKRLRRAREIAGLTAPQLATLLRLGKRGAITISEWENDKVKSLKASSLQALSAALNVSIDFLVHGPRATISVGEAVDAADDYREKTVRVQTKKKAEGE